MPGSRFRLLFAAGLLAAALVAAASGNACRGSRAACAVCARDECRALAFRVEFADGGAIDTCCARCASHAVRERPGRDVARLLAADFATGVRFDAREAIFVEGSDYEHCAAPRTDRGEAGCCLERTYDRCLPSLLAFRDREAAARFAAEHGGSLRAFGDLRFGEGPAKEGRR